VVKATDSKSVGFARVSSNLAVVDVVILLLLVKVEVVHFYRAQNC
jgi:hypothetical protein